MDNNQSSIIHFGRSRPLCRKGSRNATILRKYGNGNELWVIFLSAPLAAQEQGEGSQTRFTAFGDPGKADEAAADQTNCAPITHVETIIPIGQKNAKLFRAKFRLNCHRGCTTRSGSEPGVDSSGARLDSKRILRCLSCRARRGLRPQPKMLAKKTRCCAFAAQRSGVEISGGECGVSSIRGQISPRGLRPWSK